MNQNISFKHTLTIGLMLFALFFGAGNLVFPVMMGQLAGEHFWQANLGFLLTGVGLPLLATIAFGFSGSKNLLSLTSRVHPLFGIGYTTLLYLTIGPLFAMPRTGSVAFEIGIKSHLDSNIEPLILAIFTLLFFGITLIFSLNPAKMIDIVGKILTPALLVFIALLAIAVIRSPIGEPQQPVENYETAAFFQGFQSGYLTMDALAAFVFAIIVIDAIRSKGAAKRNSILITCIQAAFISALLLAVIYTSLTYLGATSVEAFGLLSNGGATLSETTHYYFGKTGSFILAMIVLLACLTTAIGLTTACSSYFHKLIPRISYRSFCVWMSVVSAGLANFGLEQLIQFSEPVLSILYPMAIVLTFLTFAHPLFRGKRSVYTVTLLLTFIASLINTLAPIIDSIGPIDDWLADNLLYYDLGLGWLIPAFAGILLGLLIPKRKNKQII